jgi:hypothetical protein
MPVDRLMPQRPPRGDNNPGLPGYGTLGDTIVHYYSFVPQDILIYGAMIVVVGGFAVAVGTAAPVIVAAVEAGEVLAAIGAGGTLVGTGIKAYNQLSALHTKAGTKGTDILGIKKRLLDRNGNPAIIKDIEVQLVDQHGNIIGRGWHGNYAESYGPFPGSTFGARIQYSKIGTNDPAVAVHWWYDAGTAVRYRVVYYTDKPGCSIVN